MRKGLSKGAGAAASCPLDIPLGESAPGIVPKEKPKVLPPNVIDGKGRM